MPKNYSKGRFRADRSGDHAAPRRRRRWPWVLLGVVVVLAGIGGVGAVFALQAFEVRDDLLEAKDHLSSVTDLVKAGDTAQIEAVAAETLALTTHASEIVEGPLWEIAANVPIVGVNISAVRSATEATHVLVRDAMPPALQLMGTLQLDKLAVEGGGINLDPFKGAVDVLPTVNAAFADAQSRVADIDRKKLIPLVDNAIGQLLDVMDDAGPALAMIEKYLPTLLQLAGSDGPRTYIVLFQNNAEIRATGGNSATSAIIDVDNGSISMREDRSVDRFHFAGIRGEGSLDLPQETLNLYEWDFAKFSQNYTRTPDFPTSAQMYRSLWQTTNGGEIDGVISIDPVMLSFMLNATGPVKLTDGSEINADNAVQVLLHDSYERFGSNGLAADAYFADVAGQIFDAFSSGDWDPLKMIDQLTRGAEEQRTYLWFTRDAEQALATELGIDGKLTADNSAKTQVGIYLNDSSYSKLEYWLSTSMAVSCDAAARTMTTTLTANSTVPGTNISTYAVGHRNDNMGLSVKTMLLDVLYFAPPGATIDASDPESGDIGRWNRASVEGGHQAKSMTIALGRGETRTVSFTSTLPAGELGPLAVRYTPTVTETPVTIDASCDALFG